MTYLLREKLRCKLCAKAQTGRKCVLFALAAKIADGVEYHIVFLQLQLFFKHLIGCCDIFSIYYNKEEVPMGEFNFQLVRECSVPLAIIC